MKVTQEMYSTLYNAITDANRKIAEAQQTINEAVEILDDAQVKTEEIYIDMEDDDEFVSEIEEDEE